MTAFGIGGWIGSVPIAGRLAWRTLLENSRIEQDVARRPAVVERRQADPAILFLKLAVLSVTVLVLVFGGYELLERTVLEGRLGVDALYQLHLVRGITASLILAVLVAWYLLRKPVAVYPTASEASDLPGLLNRSASQRQHVYWFIHMRWIAVVFSGAIVLIAVPVSHFLPARSLIPLLSWWSILVAANLAFARWVNRDDRYIRQLAVQTAVDLVILTGFVNASGGLENPIYFAYLFHVIIAGILLPKRQAELLTLAAGGLFCVVAFGEYFHVLPHFTIRLFPHQLEAVGGHEHAAEGLGHASHNLLFVLGRVIPFLIVLSLSAYLTHLIAERLRRADRQLAAAARTLMLEHQRLERVVESSGVGMMLVEPNLDVVWRSRRVGNWLAIDAGGEAERCPLYDGHDSGCKECIAETVFRTGRQKEVERAAVAEDGSMHYFRHVATPVQDRQGAAIQVVELIEDVTTRKALEAEALHTGKLSVLGQMAAGVAHEIGNPLSSLSARLQLLDRNRDPGFINESLHLLRGQIDRIRRIVRGVSAFARPRHQERALLDINEILAEALEIVEMDRRVVEVDLQRELANDICMVRGVRDQLTQVLLNLLLNGLEAMPEGGVLTVKTERAGQSIRVGISDTGSGIPDDLRGRIFEPFVSSKPDGSGLGLSISYSFVNAHSGHLDVRSQPGTGSTFLVSLPVADEPSIADR